MKRAHVALQLGLVGLYLGRVSCRLIAFEFLTIARNRTAVAGHFVLLTLDLLSILADVVSIILNVMTIALNPVLVALEFLMIMISGFRARYVPAGSGVAVGAIVPTMPTTTMPTTTVTGLKICSTGQHTTCR